MAIKTHNGQTITAASDTGPTIPSPAAAGDRLAASGAGAFATQPAKTALGNKSGAVALTLTGGTTHTCTFNGTVTGITPSGLADGESCILQQLGTQTVTTTGVTAMFTGALADAGVPAFWVILRVGSTYYASCKAS